MRIPIVLTDPKKLVIYLLILVVSLLAILQRDIFFYLFGLLTWSFIFAYLLNPIVSWLQSQGMPRAIAIIALYAVIFGAVAMMFVFIIPRLIDDFSQFRKQLPQYVKGGQQYLGYYLQKLQELNAPAAIRDTIYDNIQRLQDSVLLWVTNAVEWLLSLFSRLLSAVIIPVISFYLLKDKRSAESFLLGLLPRSQRSVVLQLLRRVDNVLGAWIRGQVLVSLIVFIFSFFGLYLVGMEYPLMLGIFSGITNIIPYFGPIIGAVPGVFLALLVSPSKAIAVSLVYLVVQQTESTIIAPQIMGKQIGLPPALVIVALLGGGRVGGIIGMVFAVPVAAIIKVAVQFFADYRASKLSRVTTES